MVAKFVALITLKRVWYVNINLCQKITNFNCFRKDTCTKSQNDGVCFYEFVVFPNFDSAGSSYVLLSKFSLNLGLGHASKVRTADKAARRVE